jgi:hypothetical protein
MKVSFHLSKNSSNGANNPTGQKKRSFGDESGDTSVYFSTDVLSEFADGLITAETDGSLPITCGLQADDPHWGQQGKFFSSSA